MFAPLGSVTPLDTLQRFDLWEFIKNQVVLYLPNWWTFQENPSAWALNYSAWSIRYEFWCYVLVAALGLLGILRRRFWVVLFLVAWMLLYALQLAGQIGPDYIFETARTAYVFGYFQAYLELISLFIAGVLFYVYREQIPYSRWLALLALIILLAFGLLGWGLRLVFPIAGTYLLFYVGFHRQVQFHGFGSKRDLSYGVYLYAFPIQQLIVRFLGPQMPPVVHFLLALPFVFAFALLSWYLIEKPAMSLKEFRFGQLAARRVLARSRDLEQAVTGKQSKP
jgi:peptidoglycan/LPS O-acetylase OafA/YrhL